MGYAGHLEQKNKAIELRKKGLSYSEIQDIIEVPKSTLSDWCRDIALTEKQALRLFKNKLTGSAKGRVIGAKRQQKKRLDQISEMLEMGKKQIGNISERDSFITGIVLYSAEGTKGEKGIGFTNSDPLLIKFMMKWFRRFCQIPENKFRGAIWLHEGLDDLNAIKYWSNLTKIPLSQFHKTYIARDKTNSNKIRKNIHNYGVFSIRISDLKTLRLIKGWISGIFG